MPDMPPLVMENITMIFRNFQGKEDLYNRAGDRNFSISLPPEVADAMSRDGWNVKALRAREEGDAPGAHLSVAVSYKVRPPKVWLVTSRGRTLIEEEDLDMLDWVEIKNVDVVLNPHQWGPNPAGKSGIKAYLKTLFVTIDEDPLELKYADIPSARN